MCKYFKSNSRMYMDKSMYAVVLIIRCYLKTANLKLE